MNIAEYARQLHHEDGTLSKEAREEIEKMNEVSLEMLTIIRHGFKKSDAPVVALTAKNEQKTDDMSESFRNNQLQRMRAGTCNAQKGILYSEMITDFERIGDHALNIAEQYPNLVK